MVKGAVTPGTKRRKTCAVGGHSPDLVLVQARPMLLRCPQCDHYLGDEAGLTNYGPDRPMLPVAS